MKYSGTQRSVRNMTRLAPTGGNTNTPNRLVRESRLAGVPHSGAQGGPKAMHAGTSMSEGHQAADRCPEDQLRDMFGGGSFSDFFQTFFSSAQAGPTEPRWAKATRG